MFFFFPGSFFAFCGACFFMGAGFHGRLFCGCSFGPPGLLLCWGAAVIPPPPFFLLKCLRLGQGHLNSTQLNRKVFTFMAKLDPWLPLSVASWLDAFCSAARFFWLLANVGPPPQCRDAGQQNPPSQQRRKKAHPASRGQPGGKNKKQGRNPTGIGRSQPLQEPERENKKGKKKRRKKGAQPRQAQHA